MREPTSYEREMKYAADYVRRTGKTYIGGGFTLHPPKPVRTDWGKYIFAVLMILALFLTDTIVGVLNALFGG